MGFSVTNITNYPTLNTPTSPFGLLSSPPVQRKLNCISYLIRGLTMNFTKTLLATTCLLLATASQAVVINSSNPYNFSWNFASAAGALTGSGSMTFSGLSSNELSVAVTLNNTSGVGNRLTAFGFGIDPNVSSVTFNDAADGGMVGASKSAIPSLALIEVCAYGGNNCAGGGNGGILGGGGNSDTFTLKLKTAANNGIWGNSVDVNPIGFKYQTGNGSFEFTTDPTVVVTSVPEPETYAMLLAGLGLMGSIVRRRNKSA